MLADAITHDPKKVARRLEAWGAEREWAGSDPYDGLNATRFVGFLRRSVLGRRLLTQLVKRSPMNLRGPFGIRPRHSAAAVANLAAAYARNGFLPPDEAQQKLTTMIGLLEGLRLKAFDEPCWGYHFDVQTRVFFYSSGAPNTIATAFAAMALLDAYEHGGIESALPTAIGAGDFFLRHIPQTKSGAGAYFGYLVGDRTPIHNANMLVCALLARLSLHTRRPEFKSAARRGLAYTLAHQRSDGSWPYGEEPHLGWVDNFHSGYVLDCLMTCLEAGMDEAETALEEGLAFYRDALFLSDGTPKYMPDSVYPVDIQCAAQGIQTFSSAARLDRAYLAKACQVFEYTVAHLGRSDGAFAFQRRRNWTNRTPHVRWAAAPMLMALTHLIGTTEEAR